MTTAWVVLKYMPDLQRRETRNVAVAVLHGNGAEIRALGQRPDGTIDGTKTRTAVRSTDNFRGWLSYWGYLAHTNAPIEEWVVERPGDNYIVEAGGSLLFGDESDPAILADELFRELVIPPAKRRETAREFSGEVEHLLRRAGLLDRQDYLGGTVIHSQRGETYRYPHVWQNGHLTVAVGLPRFSVVRARDLLWQFEHLPNEVTTRLVFTRAPISDRDDATAGLLDEAANVLPMGSTPEDVASAFHSHDAA